MFGRKVAKQMRIQEVLSSQIVVWVCEILSKLELSRKLEMLKCLKINGLLGTSSMLFENEKSFHFRNYMAQS